MISGETLSAADSLSGALFLGLPKDGRLQSSGLRNGGSYLTTRLLRMQTFGDCREDYLGCHSSDLQMRHN